MDNVIPFRRVENKHTPKAFVKELLEKMGQVEVPDVLKSIIGNLGKSEHMNGFPVERWKYNNFLFGDYSNEDKHFFMIESTFRAYLSPNFGTQDHRSYLQISYWYTNDEPETTNVPDDLVDLLYSYFSCYPDIESDNSRVCYAVLESLVDNTDLGYIPEESNDAEDVYTLSFAQQVDALRPWLRIRLTINYLPMLLDDAGGKFAIEQMQQ